jgi:hypothetical protein
VLKAENLANFTCPLSRHSGILELLGLPGTCTRIALPLSLTLMYIVVSLNKVKPKGIAVPLQACSCPEGSRKLRFPDFMTTAQDGGKVVSLTQRLPLHPANTPGTHFC